MRHTKTCPNDLCQIFISKDFLYIEFLMVINSFFLFPLQFLCLIRRFRPTSKHIIHIIHSSLTYRSKSCCYKFFCMNVANYTHHSLCISVCIMLITIADGKSHSNFLVLIEDHRNDFFVAITPKCKTNTQPQATGVFLHTSVELEFYSHSISQSIFVCLHADLTLIWAAPFLRRDT